MQNSNLSDFQEGRRLASLRGYSILDTPVEQVFDELTRLASQICETPVALITLLDEDRQWFKSTIGTEVKQTIKEIAFCAHTIVEPKQKMMVKDLRMDNRFSANPLVTGDPNVVFYAGVSLVTEDGYPLGTLCVLDMEPKELNEMQLFALEVLAKQVMTQLEMRKKIADQQKANESLLEAHTFIQKFASTVAHDLKNPLSSLRLSSQLLEKHLEARGDQKALKMIGMNISATENMISIVEEMLEYSRDPAKLLSNLQVIATDELLDKIQSMITVPDNVNIEIIPKGHTLVSSKVALEQIFLNLLTNAIRYSDKGKSLIRITVKETVSHYMFLVKDNGIGIPEHRLDDIFQKNITLDVTDRFNQKGSGLGLSTVKLLVEKLQGNIKVESEPGVGSCFIFTIKKVEI